MALIHQSSWLSESFFFFFLIFLLRSVAISKRLLLQPPRIYYAINISMRCTGEWCFSLQSFLKVKFLEKGFKTNDTTVANYSLCLKKKKGRQILYQSGFSREKGSIECVLYIKRVFFKGPGLYDYEGWQAQNLQGRLTAWRR